MLQHVVKHVWNVMAHAQKPNLVYQRNGRVHLNRRGSQFSRLLAVEECGSEGWPWIDHVPRHSARVVATLSNRLFPLHLPSHASPCAITFRTAYTYNKHCALKNWKEKCTFSISLYWMCLCMSVRPPFHLPKQIKKNLVWTSDNILLNL